MCLEGSHGGDGTRNEEGLASREEAEVIIVAVDR